MRQRALVRFAPECGLRHLALLVRDIRQARRFYETYFGFNASAEWSGDVLFVKNDEGFDLAFMKGEHPPNPGAFHHFGFELSDRTSVSNLLARLKQASVPIIEEVDDSFKCVDPDGYTVEVYFTSPEGTPAQQR
jgi:catechol 2,3-dioxygenase-like lactoylglutathione lyase family enzyme